MTPLTARETQMLEALKACRALTRVYKVIPSEAMFISDAIAACEVKPHVWHSDQKSPDSTGCCHCGANEFDPIHIKPHAYSHNPCNGLCLECRRTSAHEAHTSPATPEFPTREELIDALRRAERLWGQSPWECLQEIKVVLAKCDTKPVSKPRRWVVEFPDAPQTHMMPTEHDNCSVKVIREAKPITREQMSQAFESAPACMDGTDLLRECLVRLGIEVED